MFAGRLTLEPVMLPWIDGHAARLRWPVRNGKTGTGDYGISAFKTAFDMIVLGSLGFVIAGPLGLMLGLVVAALLSVGPALKLARPEPPQPRQSWMESVFDRVLGKP